MNILAVDTSGKSLSLAYCVDDKLVAEFTLQQGYNHSVTQMPLLEQLLAAADIKIPDIDLFTCTIGPGSFTGIRIGVSSIKAMAYASGRPAVGVSSLEALVYPYRYLENALVCAAVDARRGRVFSGLWRVSGDHMESLIAPANRLAVEMAADIASAVNEEKLFLAGDGQDVVRAELEENYKMNLFASDGSGRCISAYAVAQLGLAAYRNGADTEPQNLMPEYLSPSQAERMRNQRQ